MRLIIRWFRTTISRFKLASTLNVLGLSAAFAAFILIIGRVTDELSYDRFHRDADRIYRIEARHTEAGNIAPNLPRNYFEAIIRSSAHIESGTVMLPSYGLKSYVTTGEGPDKKGFTEDIGRVTEGYIETFSPVMVAGSADALKERNLALIPQSMAERMFGTEQCVGQLIAFADYVPDEDILSPTGGRYPSRVYVGGVYRDFPRTSVFQNILLTRMDDNEARYDWNTGVYMGFVKLDSPANRDLVLQEFGRNFAQTASGEVKERYAFRLTPVTDIYFTNDLQMDPLDKKGNRSVTLLLIVVAVLVIAIAAINYVNFSMAITPMRIRSINTHKILGCSVAKLRATLTAEAVLTALISYGIAMLLIWFIQNPPISAEIASGFVFSERMGLLAVCLALPLAVGLVAGLYPALYMTSFPPALAIKGAFSHSVKGRWLRTSLIGFQYVASIALIVCACFVYLQDSFMMKYNMGFDKENIAVVELGGEMYAEKGGVLTAALKENPAVREVAYTQLPFVSSPANMFLGINYRGEHYFCHMEQVTGDFPSLLGITPIQGRSLLPEDEVEGHETIVTGIFNQTAADRFRLTVGELIDAGAHQIRIAGIFPDIHFKSLHNGINPMGLVAMTRGKAMMTGMPVRYAYIRFNGDARTVAEHIEKSIHRIDPAFPVSVRMFDDALRQAYGNEIYLNKLILSFSLLAILLSVMGVFGLVVFEAQHRAKEIGIRKILGATVAELLVMINRNFIRIVLVSTIIAVPLAWYVVRQWLGGFAYRVDIHWWVFTVVVLLVLLLTAAIVTTLTWNTATMNPVRSIKTE